MASNCGNMPGPGRLRMIADLPGYSQSDNTDARIFDLHPGQVPLRRIQRNKQYPGIHVVDSPISVDQILLVKLIKLDHIPR